MTRKLLDTTVLIDLARGDHRAADFVDSERRAGNDLCLSVVSGMEPIVGCRDKAEVERMSRLIEDFTQIDLNPVVSRRAYDLIVLFSRSHGLVIPDALIAGTALTEDIQLVTHNVRHFETIPGLLVERPY